MSCKLGINAQNYIDPIRTCSQNLEGLHRTNQEQHACSKPSCRGSSKRVLRDAQCEYRRLFKISNISDHEIQS